jgi:hypothetical protein
MRPDRPVSEEGGPVVPGLQVDAGQSGQLAPVSCGEGASPSLTVGDALLPITGQFSVYLFDIDDGSCFALSANVSFPPPRVQRLPSLVARAPLWIGRPAQQRRGIEYISLRIGAPAQALLDAGLPPDHRYLLIAQLAEIADIELAAGAVDQIAALALIMDPPVAEPDPEFTPDLPAPSPPENEDLPPAGIPTPPAPADDAPEDLTPNPFSLRGTGLQAFCPV